VAGCCTGISRSRFRKKNSARWLFDARAQAVAAAAGVHALRARNARLDVRPGLGRGAGWAASRGWAGARGLGRGAELGRTARAGPRGRSWRGGPSGGEKGMLGRAGGGGEGREGERGRLGRPRWAREGSWATFPFSFFFLFSIYFSLTVCANK
jgi:hypothetical protein